MLSESRERQKWSSDPNGTNWSRDSSKFGTKMLEKMGWTQGKGLGANEDGSTEHIRVQKKNDLRGVGCSTKETHNWVAHQDHFSSLLAELNDHHSDHREEKGTNEEKGVSKLEICSKSQKRVHYHKFARGKDLSNYGDENLAAIFGKRYSQSVPSTPINLSEDEPSSADSSSSCPVKKKKRRKKHKLESGTADSPSNHVTSTVSVHEYFAKRMAALKYKASQSETVTTQGSSEYTASRSEMVTTQSSSEKEHSITEDQQQLKIVKSLTEGELKNREEEKRRKKIKKTKKKKLIAVGEEQSRTGHEEPVSDKPREKKKKSKLERNNGIAEEIDSKEQSCASAKKKTKKRKLDKISRKNNISPKVER